MWGATRLMRLIGCLTLFQSTHPCGVRPVELISAFVNIVSIHAPVWGATTSMLKIHKTHKVSIHAPVWGATINSRSIKSLSRVSIHAPVWGATVINAKKEVSSSFNPRTRVGCDLIGCLTLLTIQCFNPRTRVGCDIRFYRL